MAQASEKAIYRRVFFFRLSLGEMTLTSLQEAIRHINGLPFDESGKYLATTSKDILLALFVVRAEFPIRLQFGRIKRSDLPLIEDKGVISPLKIARSAGVLDWSHIVIFQDGVVAVESNRDAPRISKLSEYIAVKARINLVDVPKFLPLFERSIIDELGKFKSVSVLEVEAPTSDADAIARADKDLGRAFKACRSASNARTAKLILRSPVKNDPLSLRSLAEKLFRNPESREVLNKLKLTGLTDKGRRPIDLLEEYLVSTEKFMRVDPRTRAIATDEAFRVIEVAY